MLRPSASIMLDWLTSARHKLAQMRETPFMRERSSTAPSKLTPLQVGPEQVDIDHAGSGRVGAQHRGAAQVPS